VRITSDNVARWLRRLVVAMGAAAVLVLPQFTTNASFAGVKGAPGPLVVLSLGLAFWLMPVLVAASWVAEGRARIVHGWLALPVALWVAGVAISTASASDAFSALVRGAEMAGLWVGFWALVQAIRTEGERRFLLAMLVGAAVVCAIVAIYQAAFGLPSTWTYFQEHRAEVLAEHGIVPGSWAEKVFIGRFTGGVQAGLGHPNVLAALLVVGALVAAGLAREKWSEAGTPASRRFALAVIAAGVICAVGVFLTQSRGGVVALAAGLYWLAVAWRVRRRGLRIALVLAPLVAGGIAVAAAAAIDQPAVQGAILSLRYRLDYWQATAQILRRWGLAGVGLENFGLYYTEFKLPTAPEEIRDPHNLILSVWSNLGVAGLAALAALVVVAVRAWVRNLPRAATVRACPEHGEGSRVSSQEAGPASGEDTPGLTPAARTGEPLSSLLVPTALIAAPGVIVFFMLGWPIGVVAVAAAALVAALATAEDPSRLEAPERPLDSARTACIAALAAFALMEQIGTAILEPPTLWAALLVVGASLSLGGESPRGRRGSGGVFSLGSGAKFALMFIAMAAVFGYVKWLVVPVLRERALLEEAERWHEPDRQDGILRCAAEVNPLAWEPQMARGRLWQDAGSAAKNVPDISGRMEQAMAAYQEALARVPRLRRAYLALAQCRLSMPSVGREDRAAWADALRYVEDARRLYPTDIPTQLELATLVDWLGDAGRAIAEYKRTLELERLMPEPGRRLPPDVRSDIDSRVRQLEESLAKRAPAP
jgi:tetratricopeptide (TPR) repeat protein